MRQVHLPGQTCWRCKQPCCAGVSCHRRNSHSQWWAYSGLFWLLPKAHPENLHNSDGGFIWALSSVLGTDLQKRIALHTSTLSNTFHSREDRLMLTFCHGNSAKKVHIHLLSKVRERCVLKASIEANTCSAAFKLLHICICTAQLCCILLIRLNTAG